MDEWIVGERRRRAHPERIRVANLAAADPGRRVLAHVDEERRRAGRQRVRVGAAPSRDPVEAGALDARLERRDHREDHLAVLHRPHVPGRERAPVAVAIDMEDDRTVDASRPEEVPVQGMRKTVRIDRRAGGAQRLGGNLPAVEREACAGTTLVLAAEQVAVERLQVEEVGEPACFRSGVVRLHARSPGRRSSPPTLMGRPETPRRARYLRRSTARWSWALFMRDRPGTSMRRASS